MNAVTKDLLKALKIVTSQLERVGDTRKHKDGEFIDIGREAIARAEASTSASQPDISLVMLMVDRYVAEAEVDGLMRGNASAQTLAAKKTLEEYLRGMCLKHAGHCETNDADSAAKGVNRE